VGLTGRLPVSRDLTVLQRPRQLNFSVSPCHPEKGMLREDDIRLHVGRASHGGDFLRLTHVPSGVSRYHPGPLRGLNQHALVQNWLREIEAELTSKGQSRYIVADYRTKSVRRKQRGG
jgi:hypothetical protein